MITTFDSKCLKCLNGEMHPWHDNGKPVVVDEGPSVRMSDGVVLGRPHGNCGCNCHVRKTSADT